MTSADHSAAIEAFVARWSGASGSERANHLSATLRTKCFDGFPFPAAPPDQQARIRELAEAQGHDRRLRPEFRTPDVQQTLVGAALAAPARWKTRAGWGKVAPWVCST